MISIEIAALQLKELKPALFKSLKAEKALERGRHSTLKIWPGEKNPGILLRSID